MITIWVPKRLVEIDLYNVAARNPQALLDERQIQRIGVLVVQRAVRQARIELCAFEEIIQTDHLRRGPALLQSLC